MYRKVLGCFLLVLISLAGLSVAPNSIFAAESKVIKLGVLLPLSGGTFAEAGLQAKEGFLMALDEINKEGGALGKKIELIIEDDMGKPEVGVAAAEKLINRDKVAVLLGGYSSTITYAIMGAIKRYEPVVAWIGAGAPKVEKFVGKERWYFHYHPVSYHRQAAVRNFLDSLKPRPKTIALAYEDGLYGTDSATVAKGYLEKAGFEIVLFEPYKSKATDFTPLLTKIKKLNPDIYYWVGYAGDCILMIKQSKEIDFNPKLFLAIAVNFPDYKPSLGKTGDWVAGSCPWIPQVGLPAAKEFMKKYRKYNPTANGEPEYWVPLGYINLRTVVDAIRKAGSLEKNKIIAALEKTDYASAMGRIRFTKDEGGGIHQAIQSHIITQWQNGQPVVVWPAELAGGTVKYPTPPWNQR